MFAQNKRVSLSFIVTGHTLLFLSYEGPLQHLLPEEPGLIAVEDLLCDVALRLHKSFELLLEVLCSLRICTSRLPMACNAVDASPVLELLESALTGIERSLFTCQSAWCLTNEAVIQCPCFMTYRRLVNAVARELLLVDPHEKQVLDLIQNLRALLFRCNELRP